MFNSLTQDQIGKLPTYQGELLLTQHSAGSISSQAYMKRWNRKNELLADSAERASVGATLHGTPYPSKRIYDAWDLFLGSQMHDMLPGTSIPKAYEYCWNDELLAQNQFAAIERDAVAAVSATMDTRAKGTSLVVYNPLSIARQDVVEALVPATTGAVNVIGPDGHSVPTQVIGREGANLRILFLASVPSVGFASYDVRPASESNQTSNLRAEGNVIENANFRVTINRAGDIASVYDKVNRRETLKSPARLAMVYHNPTQYPAWNMDWKDAKEAPREYVSGPAKIRIVENGPVRVSIQIERETAGSKFVQQVRLSAGSAGDRVEIANDIDWQTKERVLKASFPLAAGNPKATYELQVGAIERGNNDEKKYEVPQHQWLDLTDRRGNYGVGILNDSKFGSDKPDDNTVRMTMIYTPGVQGGFADQLTQDHGRHNILFALAPHAGDWRSGGVTWDARRLNQPLRAYAVPGHDGPDGKQKSLFSVSTNQVEISAIKKAEASSEVVVRLRELTGRPANNVAVSAAAGIVSAREVDGQEQSVASAQTAGGKLVTNLSPFTLRAFAIKLKTAGASSAIASRSIALPFNADVVSSDRNRSDGAFDTAGRTLAAEQLPKSLVLDGVPFAFGKTTDGAKNAVVARGQKITLPAGSDHVYLIAASSDGDAHASFSVGSLANAVTIQDWSGYVGQWDNRIWDGALGANFTNYGPMIGLVPGFTKPGEVAWYSSHRHNPKTGNEYYTYSYLYKVGFEIPTSGGVLTLPNDPRIKIMAISTARTGVDSAKLVSPTVESRNGGAMGSPVISPSGGSFSDATTVSVTPPLYHSTTSLRYTTDGSTPDLHSKVYSGPITFNRDSRVRVASVWPNGRVDAVAAADFKINDHTAPTIASARVVREMGAVTLTFSEPVSKSSAEKLSNYTYESNGATLSPNFARLKADQRTVELEFDPSNLNGATKLVVDGIKDLSPAANAVVRTTPTVKEFGAAYIHADETSSAVSANNVRSLPTKGTDRWTLNLLVRPSETPLERTIIGGFGRSVDGQTGKGRYFTNFAPGLNFWIANRDIATTTGLEVGKWQMLTATYDGKTVRLYKNGAEIGSGEAELEDDNAQVRLLPLDAWERERRFSGSVRDFSIWDVDLSTSAVKRLWQKLQSRLQP